MPYQSSPRTFPLRFIHDNFNIIFPSPPRPSKWSLTLFPTKTPYATFLPLRSASWSVSGMERPGCQFRESYLVPSLRICGCIPSHPLNFHGVFKYRRELLSVCCVLCSLLFCHIVPLCITVFLLCIVLFMFLYCTCYCIVLCTCIVLRPCIVLSLPVLHVTLP
jgi:hypothetical protein